MERFKDQLSDDGRQLTVERDPRLSEAANETLAEELRDATGAERSELHGAAAGIDPAGAPGRSGDAMSNRLMLAVVAAVLVVVAAIVGLASGSVGALVVALVVLIGAGAGVAWTIAHMTREVEAPGAAASARLQEAGVDDPEAQLSDRVDRITDDQDDEHRSSHAHQAPGHAASEQRDALTPTSRPSRAVGGDD